MNAEHLPARYRIGGLLRRLQVEHLEDRRLLAVFIVENLLDGPVSAPGDLPGSLRQAIYNANNNPGSDQIVWQEGVSGTIMLTEGELAITDELTIDATAPSGGLTIDASGSDPTPDENNGDGSRIFNIDDGDDGTDSLVTISGLMLTGADVDGVGGAIRTKENLTVTSSTISGNSVGLGDGPGIRASGNVTVTNCTISGNWVRFGFGGGIHASGNVTVTNSTISGNGARFHGGGIYASGNVAVTSSTISGNTSNGYEGEGGGICAGGDVTVTSSTISGNSTDGGGGGLRADTVTVTWSTISGNSARYNGGGIFAFGDVRVTSSTISGNSAERDGGGIRAWGDVTVTVENSIVAGNTDDDTAPDIRPGINPLTVRYSLIGDNTGSGLVEAPVGTPDENGNLIGGPNHGIIDPLLGPLADNGGPTETHALLAGSPAIDAGNPDFSPPPEFDQRGAPFLRVYNDRIDMGAYEYQINVTLPGDFDSDGDADGDDFLIWQAGFGLNATGDADGDGDTDGDDFLIWQSQFGSEASGSAAGAKAQARQSTIDNALTPLGRPARFELRSLIDTMREDRLSVTSLADDSASWVRNRDVEDSPLRNGSAVRFQKWDQRIDRDVAIESLLDVRLGKLSSLLRV